MRGGILPNTTTLVRYIWTNTGCLNQCHQERQSRKLINLVKTYKLFYHSLFSKGLSRVSRSGFSQTGRNEKLQLDGKSYCHYVRSPRKMGYRPSLFGQWPICVFQWTKTESGAINSIKKNEANTQPSLPNNLGQHRIYCICLAEFSCEGKIAKSYSFG